MYTIPYFVLQDTIIAMQGNYTELKVHIIYSTPFLDPDHYSPDSSCLTKGVSQGVEKKPCFC